MRLRRPAVAVWALLVAGGWGLTLWLDEPAATSGPGPVRAPGSAADPEPGPQPESGRCGVDFRTERSPSGSPSPAASAWSAPPYEPSPGNEARTLHAYDCAVAR